MEFKKIKVYTLHLVAALQSARTVFLKSSFAFCFILTGTHFQVML